MVPNRRGQNKQGVKHILLNTLRQGLFFSALYMHLCNSNFCSEYQTIMLNTILQIY